MGSIHETALVHPGCDIAADVSIGAYAIIEEGVSIGTGSDIGHHVVVHSGTSIGERSRFFPFSSIGSEPQDLKFQGEASKLQIGSDNIIREMVTINRGTGDGGGITQIGDHNMLMAYSHVAHDCHVGSHTVFANAATLAGHVEIADHATIGAFSAVHQFCRVGPYAFVGGFSVITRDTLPYLKTVGARGEAKTFGVNVIGLERKGISADAISELKRADRIVRKESPNRIRTLEALNAESWNTAECRLFVEFIAAATDRGIIV